MPRSNVLPLPILEYRKVSLGLIKLEEKYIISGINATEKGTVV